MVYLRSIYLLLFIFALKCLKIFFEIMNLGGAFKKQLDNSVPQSGNSKENQSSFRKACTYTFVNLECMLMLWIMIIIIWKRMIEWLWRWRCCPRVHPRAARGRHRPPPTPNPKTDEDVKQRREGWHDIHVQGRPHRDGTGNANLHWPASVTVMRLWPVSLWVSPR